MPLYRTTLLMHFMIVECFLLLVSRAVWPSASEGVGLKQSCACGQKFCVGPHG